MEDFQVPKDKASVLVEIPPRPPVPRHVFLAPFAQGHRGAEAPSDILNAAQTFVPLFDDDGNTVLARRAAITWIMVGDPRRTEWYYYELRAGAPETPVHIEFDTGSHLDGRVALLGPEGGRRVIDVVNRSSYFLHLERDEELFLVNLRRVASITIARA
ncbi:MAG TPA: hypothetical protein VN317_01770 [Candidatus Methanoperedens sp.]|nr:hypothetical protein [Candidatus Methanoperedens sp.]